MSTLNDFKKTYSDFSRSWFGKYSVKNGKKILDWFKKEIFK